VGRGINVRRAALSIAVWLLGDAAVAVAQAPTERDTAKALQVEGLKLLDQGDAVNALEKFTAAYSLVPSPRVLFNMGRAHFELGHGAEAYDCFDRFLAEAENVPPKSRADAELIRSQLRTTVALIQVAGPTGAVVNIDGRNRGRLPLDRPLAVMPGTRTITVEKDDKTVSEKRLYLAEATTTRLVVEVAPSLASPVVPVAAMASGASSSPAPVVDLSAGAATEVTRRIDKPSILGKWWFWTAATAVVAGGVIGVAAGAGWLSPDACPSGRRCM
jgi:hypothetical protein